MMDLTSHHRSGIAAAIPLLLLITACSAHYRIHPGALNAADSAAYDALLVAETTIGQARLQLQAGQLPAAAKPALDVLVRSYNVAREAWLTYRASFESGVKTPAEFDQLAKNLSDLTDAIRKFQEAIR
jgi:hypothetical protein